MHLRIQVSFCKIIKIDYFMLFRPATFLDRDEHISTNKYVFISYSHRDSDIVYPILNKLYEAGINYWYDSEMTVGDSWVKKAQEMINDINCVASMFFISKNCLLHSDAVSKEIEAVKARGIRVIPIVIDADSYYKVVQNAYIEMGSCSGATLNKEVPFERIKLFLDFFYDERLFINSNDEELTDKVISQLKKDGLDVFSTDNAIVEKFVNKGVLKSINNIYYLTACRTLNNVVNNIFSVVKHGKILTKGETFFRFRDEETFDLKPIEWFLLDIVNNKALFISADIFDIVGFRDVFDSEKDISEMIKELSEDDIDEIKLPSFEDILRAGDLIPNGKVSGLALLDSTNSNFSSCFWCVDKNGKLHCIQNSGKELSTPVAISRGALRMEITIDLQKLLEK